MKIEDLKAGDGIIIEHFGNITKIEILEITEYSIAYKNLDNKNGRLNRVSKYFFNTECKIVEKLNVKTEEGGFNGFDGAELMARVVGELCGLVAEILKIEDENRRNKILWRYYNKIEKIIIKAEEQGLIKEGNE